jgi:hypothetical protein
VLRWQRFVGNQAVGRMLDAESAVQRWPWSPAPARTPADLVTAGAGGDTDAIVEITDFSAANDLQRLQMVDHLTNKLWVGGQSEQALARIWNSFGDRLPTVASSEANLQRWSKSRARFPGLVAAVPLANRITESFASDVRSVAHRALVDNLAFLDTESQRLQLQPGAPATAESNSAVNVLQVAATSVAKLRVAQDLARQSWVGWREVIRFEEDDLTNPGHYQRVKFEPGSRAPLPSIPGGGRDFYDDERQTWQSTYSGYERLSAEQAEIRSFAEVQSRYVESDVLLGHYFSAYPTLFVLAQGGTDEVAGFGSAENPAEARRRLAARFEAVRGHIRNATTKLDSGELSPLDLTLIHDRLRSHQSPAASGTDWATAFANRLVEDQVRSHSIDRALRALLLQQVSALAAMLAPFTEGASMVALLAVGAGAAGANLALDFNHYQGLLDAQQSATSPDRAMVSAQAVDDAQMAVQADMLAFTLAALALGGAVAGAGLRALEAQRAARYARMAEQTGAPTTVTLIGRQGELPYVEPPGTIVVARGTPLNVATLDPTRRYLWIVDAEGNLRICPEAQGNRFPARGLLRPPNPGAGQTRAVHGDLAAGAGPAPQQQIPGMGATRGPARAGGELQAEMANGRPTGRWIMNNDSSYTFARDDGAPLTGANLNAAHDLLGATGTDTSRIVPMNTSGADRAVR